MGSATSRVMAIDDPEPVLHKCRIDVAGGIDRSHAELVASLVKALVLARRVAGR